VKLFTRVRLGYSRHKRELMTRVLVALQDGVEGVVNAAALQWKRAEVRRREGARTAGVPQPITASERSASRPNMKPHEPRQPFIVVTPVHFLHFAVSFTGLVTILLVEPQLSDPQRPADRTNSRSYNVTISPSLHDLSAYQVDIVG